MRPVAPDLVDAIFDLLVLEHPHLASLDMFALKQITREQFGGHRGHYVRRPDRSSTRHALALQVLSLFNGRNATEIARRLQIGRATVYRLLKQAKQSHPIP